ncbi:MAG: substrate-binding domain-containing protein, partial [Pyrinomonadaceae bacterium]|nr:substrate-binding domain-containing protein [Phycisphaerales bacterium]
GDQIMPDAYTVGELAASYLLSRGHTRLAFLNLDEEHLPLRVYGHAFAATAREEGGANITVEELQEHPIIVTPGYWRRPSQEAVDHLVNRFLALPERPTGLFVAEDRQVALLQPALQARGVAVGKDVGGGSGVVEIVSCNNERPYLVGLSPQPTEIDIRTSAVGRRGVEQLLWRLGHPEVSEQVVATVEPRLVLN